MSDGNSAEQRLQPAQANAGRASGDQGTLASSASDKQRAATFMERHLLPDTQAAGRMGEDGGTAHPPMAGPGARSSLLKPDTGLNGLSAWATDKGLSEAMSVWQMQAGWLMARLNRELNALRSTNTLLQGQDAATAAQFGPASTAPQEPFRSRINDW
ncbi:hypothetical protein ABZ442_19070 [Streptomyces triculaminicus]|uniref:hypothetical protein n=1 Tax=Streptomyces triculaminicus TaxID=2816232 RepID=UPI003405F586